MAGYTVTRLLQNPLGHAAPAGQRGDIVRVSNGSVTIYLDPAEFERSSEGGLLQLLAEADARPLSAVGASTLAGGQAGAVRDAGLGLRHRPTPDQ